ncbi:hypothetical protein PINS_up005656 [Pythium insidiosum]|nr:hypothetical protein PINS_up005656 [Pythium insidiosum]
MAVVLRHCTEAAGVDARVQEARVVRSAVVGDALDRAKDLGVLQIDPEVGGDGGAHTGVSRAVDDVRGRQRGALVRARSGGAERLCRGAELVAKADVAEAVAVFTVERDGIILVRRSAVSQRWRRYWRIWC